MHANRILVQHYGNERIIKMRVESNNCIPTQSYGKVTEKKEITSNNMESTFSDLDEYIHEEPDIYSNRTYYRIEVDQSYERPDYSTMSDGEIYNAVLDEYKYKYGDDFLERRILCLSPVSFAETTMYVRFRRELEKLIGGSKEIQAAAREAAYGDMTQEEVRGAILQQYSQKPMTLRDFMHMSYEMSRVGVDVGTRQLASLMQSDPHPNRPRPLYPKTQQEQNDYFMSIVDKPLDIASVTLHLDGIRFANAPSYSSLTTKFISNLFNNLTESNGYLKENLILRR